MAAGDVEVRVCSPTDTVIDTNLTAMRVTAGANGKYYVTPINNGQAMLLVAITEA